MCKAYTKNIHYCVALNKYIQVDDRQLVIIEGDTEAEVLGIETNTGKTTIFENRKCMKFLLFNRIELERQYKYIQEMEYGKCKKPGTNFWGHECERKLAKTCIKSILDTNTNVYIDTKMMEHLNFWIEWSLFEANNIEKTQHQINQKWNRLMMENAKIKSEENGLTIEECLAVKFELETNGSFKEGLKIANKIVAYHLSKLNFLSNLPIYENVLTFFMEETGILEEWKTNENRLTMVNKMVESNLPIHKNEAHYV